MSGIDIKVDRSQSKGYRNLISFLDALGISRWQWIRRFYGFMLGHFGFWWWRLTESYETQLVMQTVKQGNTVVDVGANIGYYTVMLSKLVGSQGKVFAFEPDPENFVMLQKNVSRLQFKNVVCEQKAVGAADGTASLFISKFNPGDHRLYDSHDGRGAVEVKTVALDTYFKSHAGGIDFFKIDVQGTEDAVLQGMAGLLGDRSKTKNLTVLTEFWPIGLKRGGVDPSRYLERLYQAGFAVHPLPSRKLFNFLEDGKSNKLSPEAIFSHSKEKRLGEITLEALVSSVKEERYVNLWCLRK